MICGCGRPGKHLKQTLCHACYERARRHGLLPARRSDEERFFALVSSRDALGCWLWAGAAGPQGYGVFKLNERTVRAHRWAYEFLRDAIPNGLHLDHLCRVPACVNPWHLEPVTGRENLVRGIAARLGDNCARGHPFAENATVRNGKRQCRACRREVYAARITPEKRDAHAARERARTARQAVA